VALRASVVAPRYILPNLLVLTLLPAYGAEYLILTDRPPRWLTGVLALALAFAVWVDRRAPASVFHALNQLPALCRYEHTAAVTRIQLFLNGSAPPGTRLLFLSYYTYHLRPDLLQCLGNGADMDGLLAGPSVEANWSRVHERGFAFVVLAPTHKEQGGKLGLGGRLPPATPQWLEVKCVFEQDGFAAYSLKCTGPSRRPLVQTREVRPGLWRIEAPRAPDVPGDAAKGN